jgi:hypothetical protein
MVADNEAVPESTGASAAAAAPPGDGQAASGTMLEFQVGFRTTGSGCSMHEGASTPLPVSLRHLAGCLRQAEARCFP